MTFAELYKFLANHFKIEISEVEIYAWYSDLDEFIFININSTKKLAGSIIDKIVIKGSIREVDCPIYECVDPDLQSEYEKRLILCSLWAGQQYNNDPTMIVEVNESYTGRYPHVSLARIIYLFTDAVYEVGDNTCSFTMWNGYNDTLNKTSILFNTIYGYEDQMTWEICTIENPEWMNYIQTRADMYKSPLNKRFHDKVHFIEDPEIYYGVNLIYKKETIAIINMNGCWIKTCPEWLDLGEHSLPEEILNELAIAKSI